MKVSITLNNEKILVNKGTRAFELLKAIDSKRPIMGITVNNVVESLDYAFKEDCNLGIVDMNSSLGLKIYERSLLFVLIKAAKKVIPDRELSIEHSLGGGIYCEFSGSGRLGKSELGLIEDEISKIIERDIPINKHLFSKEEACKKLYNRECLMKYIRGDRIALYELDGLYEYFHGHMLPSTGFLSKFKLRYYYPGFVLLYPRSNDLTIKEFVDQKKLFHVFSDYEKWCRFIDVPDVYSLNEKIVTGEIDELIKVAEAKHERAINDIAREISSNPERAKLILLAGPSSAGKTTTSKRLRTNLMVYGLKPITIELDNYFLDRCKTPKNDRGEYDYDSLEALDIELVNEHLLRLMDYREVEIPRFNFITGKRETGKKMKIGRNNLIIIEGIHGLNETLTEYIPKEQKYKIYVNALTHLNIDSHNRIPTTDIRLIRRIVRDHRTRGHNAEGTLKMWRSVREGEEKNIFPYGEEADYIFNSALIYELAVLKKYAGPLLKEIREDSDVYPNAQRIVKALDLFLPVEDETPILGNSILREFIGGSIY